MDKKPKIILIAAIGKNRELGKGPELVWKFSDDLKRFREITKGFPVVMGKKTFESIGRVLPKRVNIVVTRDTTYRHEGVVVVHSITQALETAQNVGTEKVFVIGGGEIYTQTLPFADELDLTLIDAEDKDADVFFPAYEDSFEEMERDAPRTEKSISYQWVRFKKK